MQKDAPPARTLAQLSGKLITKRSGVSWYNKTMKYLVGNGICIFRLSSLPASEEHTTLEQWALLTQPHLMRRRKVCLAAAAAAATTLVVGAWLARVCGNIGHIRCRHGRGFELDHLPAIEPVLFPNFCYFSTFILGSPFLLPQRANNEKVVFTQLQNGMRQRGLSAWGIQIGPFAGH